VIFRRVPAAHAFFADEQIFDVDARDVVAAGCELDGIARRHLRQRVVQRATGMMVVIAVPGIRAGGWRHEPRAECIGWLYPMAAGRSTAASANAGAKIFQERL
jgi:hypothetical protein